jgi:hypothetical protein
MPLRGACCVPVASNVKGHGQSSYVDRKWYAISPEKSGRNVHLRIELAGGAEPSGEWRVTVNFDGLEIRTHTLFGVDKWQALAIGMRFVAARVRHFDETGWQFFWSAGGERATVSDLGLL